MVAPTGQANLGGHQVMGIADLGFASPLTQNTTKVSNVMQENLQAVDLFVVAKFGGTVNVTVKLQQATTAALATALGSPTTLGSITDTNEHTFHAALSASGGQFWALALTENNIGAPTITELAVSSLVQVANGTMPENLQTVKNAVASVNTPNAGVGTLALNG